MITIIPYDYSVIDSGTNNMIPYSMFTIITIHPSY